MGWKKMHSIHNDNPGSSCIFLKEITKNTLGHRRNHVVEDSRVGGLWERGFPRAILYKKVHLFEFYKLAHMFPWRGYLSKSGLPVRLRGYCSVHAHVQLSFSGVYKVRGQVKRPRTQHTQPPDRCSWVWTFLLPNYWHHNFRFRLCRLGSYSDERKDYAVSAHTCTHIPI